MLFVRVDVDRCCQLRVFWGEGSFAAMYPINKHRITNTETNTKQETLEAWRSACKKTAQHSYAYCGKS